jgi:dihydrodipicolinate reductase
MAENLNILNYMSLKILLSGARGRMGKAIQSIATEHDCEISFPVDLGDNPEEGIRRLRCGD